MDYLTEKQVAEKIHRSVFTLRKDRYLRRGLPYTKFLGQILYPVSSIEKYLESKIVEPRED
jgi:hypothetical protein